MPYAPPTYRHANPAAVGLDVYARRTTGGAVTLFAPNPELRRAMQTGAIRLARLPTGVAFGDPSVSTTPLTQQQRQSIQQAYNRLTASATDSTNKINSAIAQAKAQQYAAVAAGGIVGWLVSMLSDQSDAIHAQQGDADQTLASIGGVVAEITQYGTITDSDTGAARVATAQDGANVLRLMSSAAQQYAAIATNASNSTPLAFARAVTIGSAERLANDAADFAEAARRLLQGVEDLLKGLGQGASAVGWLLPAAVVAAFGAVLFLGWQVASEKSRRYARS